MKKSQISVFLLIGIAFIVLIGIIFYSKSSIPAEGKREVDFSNNLNLQVFLEDCTKETSLTLLGHYGTNFSSKGNEAQIYIEQCMNSVLEKEDAVNKEIHPTVKITEEEYVITFYVEYPLESRKGDTISYLIPVETTIDKIQRIKLEGTEEELFSSDRKFSFSFPEGVKAKDLSGNEVTSFEVKILDKHFDNLNNGVVAGNVIYEGLPDGITFSKPVEISFQIDEKNIPITATEDMLSIAWWNDELHIWESLPTAYENGVLKANTTHFTPFAAVLGCNDNSDMIIDTPYFFRQKYSYINPSLTEPREIQELENDFCKNTDSRFWEENEDGTITPTEQELRKMLEDSQERIILTTQQVEGKVTYGGSQYKEDCEKEAQVDPYCCCKGETCSLTGKQECQVKKINDEAYRLYSPQDANLPDGCKDLDYSSKLRRELIGYNKRECLGGLVDKSDNADSIYSLRFYGDGDSCISAFGLLRFIFINKDLTISINEAKVDQSSQICNNIEEKPSILFYDDLEDCQLTDFSVETLTGGFSVADKDKYFAGGLNLKIKQVKVNPPESLFCSNYKAIIDIEGSGIENQEVLIACQGDYGWDNRGSAPVCRACRTSDFNPDMKVLNEKVDIENCLCDSQNVNKVFCNLKSVYDIQMDTAKCESRGKLVSYVDEGGICSSCSSSLALSTYADTTCKLVAERDGLFVYG